MVQVRMTRKELMENPEKMEQAKTIMMEFNSYLRDLKLPDIISVTDFAKTYIEDMANNPDDGLAEMRYTAVARQFFRLYVLHIIEAQKMQEFIREKLMKMVEQANENSDEDDVPAPATPFKNRKFLN